MNRAPLTPEEKTFLRSRRRSHLRKRYASHVLTFFAGWLIGQTAIMWLAGIL